MGVLEIRMGASSTILLPTVLSEELHALTGFFSDVLDLGVFAFASGVLSSFELAAQLRSGLRRDHLP